jgi:transcriptional regulator with XRE-family HTH domain
MVTYFDFCKKIKVMGVKTGKKKEYEKLKRTAYEYVVVQDYTQAETAEMLGISQKTLSEWARTGNWRELRKSRQSAASTANNNLKNIISLLSEQRLRIEQEIRDAQAAGDKDEELKLRKEASVISDDISKINKSLKDNEKSNGVTLGLIIDVMDDIFNNLRAFDLKIRCPKCGTEIDLYGEMIEFQSMYIQKKTIEIG